MSQTIPTDRSLRPVETDVSATVPDLRRLRRRDQWVLVAIIFVSFSAVVAIGALTPGFMTFDNLSVIVRNASITGIAAIGLSFVTISGGLISLAIAETASLAAILYVILTNQLGSSILSIAIVLSACAVLGAVQGVAVHHGANSILVTLGVGAALLGLASLVSQNQSVTLSDAEGTWLGRAQLFGIPSQSVAFVLLAIIATIALVKTRVGREILLTGGNRKAAAAAGIRVGWALALAFGLCSLFVGVAAVLQTSQFGTTLPFQFRPLTFDALTAVLVGGISLQGGRGTPANAALGACFVALVANILVLWDYDYGVQLTVQGILVAVAVIGFSQFRARKTR